MPILTDYRKPVNKKQMNPPLVTCHTCHGSGQEKLQEGLLETLQSLGKSEAAACEIVAEGVSVNAVNNRLERLRAMGFVKRRRAGKFWLYSRIAL